jgi:hypothetical protein
MGRFLLGIVVLIAIVVAGLVAKDLMSTPPAMRGQCVLVRRTILPDFCNNNCSPPFDCTVATRPYAVFFTQSATCADGVICPTGLLRDATSSDAGGGV